MSEQAVRADGWRAARVRNVFDVLGGGTPSTRVPEYWAGQIPWITSADIGEDLRISPRKFITRAAIDNSATNLVPKDSVIVATRVGLGKVAVADRPTCFSQDCQALLPAPETISPRFIAYQLSMATRAFLHTARGTTISGVTKKQLLDLEIRYPDLVRQRMIVDKIEELFSDLDVGVAELERAKANLAQYRAAVLKAAVEGKLTEQWRRENLDAEPALELPEPVRSGIGAKVRAFPITDVDSLPSGWRFARLGDVCRTQTGGTPRRDRPDYFDGAIPWIKSGELKDGRVRAAEETISDLGVAESSAKVFPVGTLCIALYGATVGKLGILEIDAATNQAICGISVPPGLSVEFLFYVLWSMRQELVAQGKGGAQPNISNAIVRDTVIPVPPPAEQVEIVNLIESALSRMGQAVSAVEAGERRAGQLRRGILGAAFSGHLG